MEDLKTRARDLYKAGFGSLQKIADELDINLNTLKSWKARDSEPWSKGATSRKLATKLQLKEKEIAETVIACKGNKSEAARRTGAHTKTVQRIVRKAHVQDYIKARQEELSEELKFSQELIASELFENHLRASGKVATPESLKVRISKEEEEVQEHEVYKADFNASIRSLTELRKMLGIGKDYRNSNEEESEDEVIYE